jgi:hypothetical protein
MLKLKKFGSRLKGKNHPPRNNTTVIALISSIFAYSAKKNKANAIAEYSTLYPETSSASASGKSNGCLFVSANATMKKQRKMGKCGTAYQMYFCDRIMSTKFKLPDETITIKKIKPIETS